MLRDHTGTCVRELPAAPDLLAMHAGAPQRYPVLLQSAASGTARARYDLLLALPDGGVQLGASGLRDLDGHALSGTFLDALDAAFADADQDPLPAQELPFCGGWALLLGYELAAEIEPKLRLPPAPSGPPTALALRCRGAVVHDRRSGRCVVVCERGCEHALDRIVADCAASDTAPAVVPLPSFTVQEDTPQKFLDGVRRIHGYLQAGDAFQVNLSRGWCATPAGPLAAPALYAALRAANPAPFAGLFAVPGWAVVSSSPERLLSVHGRRVETRPIAGTRPRHADGSADAEADRLRIAELIAHPKERAEHVMLIDLERNDLGRVCEPGSVRVEELMAVESYRHVHHIESTVAGTLRADISPGQAIRAVFPGGTITGCPKVRCMEIIAELEQGGRGAYTGAMGYLSRDGRMDLNILIRTLVWDGDRVRLRAGAGIVADSDPQAELAETRAKVRGLLRALGIDA